jgi:hypothetical protein
MSNSASQAPGEPGVVDVSQFGNGPLPNWILNPHRTGVLL